MLSVDTLYKQHVCVDDFGSFKGHIRIQNERY